MGREKKYDPELLAQQMSDYIDTTDDPQIAEFCLPKDMPCRDTINELSKNNQNLSDMVKRLIQKQEVYLTRCGNGNLHSSMAIFRLKQTVHGYRDKTEQDVNLSGGLADELKAARERAGK